MRLPTVLRRSRRSGALASMVCLPLVLAAAGVPGSTVAAPVRPESPQGVISLAAEALPPTAAPARQAGVPGQGRRTRVDVPSPKGDRVVVESGVGPYQIPATALTAYQRAATVLAEVQPSCKLPWTLLAAIGRVESDHGQYGGAVLGANGWSTPRIIGVRLDGTGAVAAIHDTDHGRLDGDPVWDRAVGPMQFIPSTWAAVAVDGDGDHVRSPHDINDAALAAAVYLCAGGGNLSEPGPMRAAVLRYNHSGEYARIVLAYERAYRSGDFTTSGLPGPSTFQVRPVAARPALGSRPAAAPSRPAARPDQPADPPADRPEKPSATPTKDAAEPVAPAPEVPEPTPTTPVPSPVPSPSEPPQTTDPGTVPATGPTEPTGPTQAAEADVDPAGDPAGDPTGEPSTGPTGTPGDPTPPADDPTPPAGDPTTPPPAHEPTPVVVSGTLQECGASGDQGDRPGQEAADPAFCLDGTLLDVGDAQLLSRQALADFDGDGTVEDNRAELEGLVGTTVDLTVVEHPADQDRPTTWVVQRIGDLAYRPSEQ